MRKRALVTGGAGQDGWYLIELLLSRGYEAKFGSAVLTRYDEVAPLLGSEVLTTIRPRRRTRDLSAA